MMSYEPYEPYQYEYEYGHGHPHDQLYEGYNPPDANVGFGEKMCSLCTKKVSENSNKRGGNNCVVHDVDNLEEIYGCNYIWRLAEVGESVVERFNKFVCREELLGKSCLDKKRDCKLNHDVNCPDHLRPFLMMKGGRVCTFATPCMNDDCQFKHSDPCFDWVRHRPNYCPTCFTKKPLAAYNWVKNRSEECRNVDGPCPSTCPYHHRDEVKVYAPPAALNSKAIYAYHMERVMYNQFKKMMKTSPFQKIWRMINSKTLYFLVEFIIINFPQLAKQYAKKNEKPSPQVLKGGFDGEQVKKFAIHLIKIEESNQMMEDSDESLLIFKKPGFVDKKNLENEAVVFFRDVRLIGNAYYKNPTFYRGEHKRQFEQSFDQDEDRCVSIVGTNPVEKPLSISDNATMEAAEKVVERETETTLVLKKNGTKVSQGETISKKSARKAALKAKEAEEAKLKLEAVAAAKSAKNKRKREKRKNKFQFVTDGSNIVTTEKETETNTNGNTDNKTETDSKTEIETNNTTETDSKTETDSNVETATKIETNNNVKTTTNNETETDSNVETNTNGNTTTFQSVVLKSNLIFSAPKSTGQVTFASDPKNKETHVETNDIVETNNIVETNDIVETVTTNDTETDNNIDINETIVDVVDIEPLELFTINLTPCNEKSWALRVEEQEEEKDTNRDKQVELEDVDSLTHINCDMDVQLTKKKKKKKTKVLEIDA